MAKYWVIYDYCDNKECDKDCSRCEGNWKSWKAAAETADKIHKVSSGIAPNTYVALCVAAEKFPFEFDENSSAGKYFSIGIKSLVKLGYIKINSERNEIFIIK